MNKKRNISVVLEELEQSDASEEKLAEKATAEGSNSHEPIVDKGQKNEEQPSEEAKESNEKEKGNEEEKDNEEKDRNEEKVCICT